MKWLQQIPAIFRSKYLVAAALFGIIVLFFDKNDFFTQQERKKEVRELEQSKAYYLKQMEELTRIRQDVENDPNTIEKLAREQYLMKRPNEDLYFVPGDKPVDKQEQ